VQRATVDGAELAFELHGDGDPVVLIHWGIGTGWAAPLLRSPALGGYRLLAYDRAGFGASDRPPEPVGIVAHASHCAALLRHLGIERAHVVGHSSSAMVALQLALDDPGVVGSLALLESARPAPETPVQAAFVRDFVAPAMARYRAGDVEGALETFLEGVGGPGGRDALERALPEAFAAAVADASAFFEAELPEVQTWPFSSDDAARVTQPALLVLGSESVATFRERRDLLLAWLPNAEPFDLHGASHLLLHVEPPDALAEALAGFFGRRPLG
jgi:pimeloyl-ACP methyl ester carboxylesterase